MKAIRPDLRENRRTNTKKEIETMRILIRTTATLLLAALVCSPSR